MRLCERKVENGYSFRLHSSLACRWAVTTLLAFQNLSSPRTSPIHMLQKNMVILYDSSLTHLRIWQLAGKLYCPSTAEIYTHRYPISVLPQPHWFHLHMAAFPDILPFGISDDSWFHQRWTFLFHSILPVEGDFWEDGERKSISIALKAEILSNSPVL